MIIFLLHKIWKNKLLMLCLLVGNILLVGIVSATPLYTTATMQRILQQDLQRFQWDNNTFPAVMELTYRFNNVVEGRQIDTYHTTRGQYINEIVNELNVPLLFSVQTNTFENWHVEPYPEREARPWTRLMSLTSASDLYENVHLIQGRFPANEFSNQWNDRVVIEVIASEAALVWNDLLYGELLAVSNVDFPGGYIYLHVVGIYEPSEGSDLYWSALELNHQRTLLVSDELVREYFIENYMNDFRITSSWVLVLDYTHMRARYVDGYLASVARLSERFNTGSVWEFSANFTETIQNHRARTGQLSVTLWVLQVPLYVLLAFYIHTVSRQILLLDQNIISVIKSRGASRMQILGIYALQGLFVALISLVAGIALGVFICRMLGASGGFLVFVQRTALQVELTPPVFVYAAIALFVSFFTMLLPVLGLSKVDIVSRKRRRGGAKKALWQRFYLDILCLGAAGYGLFNFNNQRELMAQTMVENRYVDPLLFISSSLFIIGLGLLCLRVFPLLVKLIFILGRRFWSPALYASMLKVIRSAGEEQFIMIFLVLTMGVGLFSTQAAGTINLNNDHNIQHLAGADLMFREAWPTTVMLETPLGGATGPVSPEPTIHITTQEPDFLRFTLFEEVDAITQVQRQQAEVRRGASAVGNVTLMGIETDTFGETIWFRDDLLEIHINYFLNVLAGNAEGVLLSDNFRTRLDYQLGDTIFYRTAANNYIRGTIVGFAEHWPGFALHSQTRLPTGEIAQTENFLLVSNLGHIQTLWGVMPYQVWMRTNTDSNSFFHDFRLENDLMLIEFNDAKAAITESRSDPILQGTNGVLTAVFVVTLLVCFTGFLIFWVLSISSRVLQFGIFRAMGMGMRELIGLLAGEQFLITLTAIGIGAVVGEITARLFVPLIQLSFTAADQAIPLIVVNQARYYWNLYVVVGAMVAICLIILGIYVSRIKIAQALKLGED